MKRGPRHGWPNKILEVPPTGTDSRAEPQQDQQVTQRISREELDAVLKRTKSGTRRAVHSDPALDGEPFAGPRDDNEGGPAYPVPTQTWGPPYPVPTQTWGPPYPVPTQTWGPHARIDSPDRKEPVPVDPLSLPPIQSSPLAPQIAPPAQPNVEVVPRRFSPRLAGHLGDSRMLRLQVTPRTALIVALAVAGFVLLAALIGFFAGRA